MIVTSGCGVDVRGNSASRIAPQKVAIVEQKRIRHSSHAALTSVPTRVSSAVGSGLAIIVPVHHERWSADVRLIDRPYTNLAYR
jgi:hypothetical protein